MQNNSGMDNNGNSRKKPEWISTLNWSNEQLVLCLIPLNPFVFAALSL